MTRTTDDVRDAKRLLRLAVRVITVMSNDIGLPSGWCVFLRAQIGNGRLSVQTSRRSATAGSVSKHRAE